MKKRFYMFLLAGAIFTGCFPSTAKAANTVDTEWRFTVTSTYSRTAARAKEDSTSIYIRLDTAPDGYVRAMAEGYMPTSYGTYTWQNKTWNVSSVVVPIGRWRIRQTIYEHGGRSARLAIARYSKDGIASGVWSPDCLGSYTSLN